MTEETQVVEVRARFWRDEARWALGALGAIAIASSTWLFLITWLRHRAWFSEAYDIGIFNQAMWLLSHAREPFVSIRVINVFGDHSSLILFLLLPFYRLWPFSGPSLLYAVQALAVSSSVVPLYRLARLSGARPSLGVAAAGAFALNPLVQNVAYEFHPEVLAIPLLLVALCTAYEERWTLFGVTAALAALAKEDISFVLVFVGLWLVLVRRKRRIGGVTMAASLLYFLFMTRVFIPRAGAGNGYLYYQRFKEYGDGMFSLLLGFVRHADLVARDVLGSEGLPYLGILLACLGPLVLLEPGLLVPAVPTIAINLLSNFEAQRNIENHYIAPALPFLFAALAVGLGHADGLIERLRLDSRGARRGLALLMAAVIVPSLTTHALYSSAEPNRRGFRPVLRRSAHTLRLEDAKQLIPPEASVSASYYLVAQMSDRQDVYLFPMPFDHPAYQAPHYRVGDQLRRIERVDYVFVDRNDVYYAEHGLFGLFANRPGETWPSLSRFWAGWEVLYDFDDILVARRPAG